MKSRQPLPPRGDAKPAPQRLSSDEETGTAAVADDPGEDPGAVAAEIARLAALLLPSPAIAAAVIDALAERDVVARDGAAAGKETALTVTVRRDGRGGGSVQIGCSVAGAGQGGLAVIAFVEGDGAGDRP